MKFSINKKELLSALQLLSKATPVRSTLPIISSGLFVVKNNKLFIRTTDLEISIKINCIISDAEDGNVAIPISKLLEITTAMPEDEINFNISENRRVNIICSSGNYTIGGQPNEEFPAEQKLDNPQTLTISSNELKNIINDTSYATSKDDLKPVLQGVFFQIEKNGIVSVATDGHRLVKTERKNINNQDYVGSIVVPTKFLNLLNTQLTSQNNISLLIGDNHIQVNINNIIITSRTIKDPYPDYEGVIPKENNKTLIVNKENFTSAIKRISIFSNKASKQIALEITENNIIITTEDPENITTGKESIDCSFDGDPMTIGYNAMYLSEVLNHQDADEVKIMLNSPLNAGIFIPIEEKENDITTTLLMPIRLND